MRTHSRHVEMVGRTGTLLNENGSSEPILEHDRIVRGGDHLRLLPHPQPATRKGAFDVHLVLISIPLRTDTGNDNDRPALTHPNGGLAGGLEAVYGSRSPVVWSARNIILMGLSDPACHGKWRGS